MSVPTRGTGGSTGTGVAVEIVDWKRAFFKDCQEPAARHKQTTESSEIITVKLCYFNVLWISVLDIFCGLRHVACIKTLQSEGTVTNKFFASH